MNRTRIAWPFVALLFGAAGCDFTTPFVSCPAIVLPPSVACFTNGCDRITVDVADPRAGDLSSVRKIAVVAFTGQEKVGEPLAVALSAKLEATGRFEVKDRPSVLKALKDEGSDQATGIDAARAARVGKALGVDAVVVGELTSLEAVGSPTNPAAPQDKGLLQTAAGNNAGGLNALLTEVHTQGLKVVINYRVINAASGDAMLSRQAAPPATTVRSLKSLNGVEQPPSAEEVIGRLADDCAARMAGEMTSPGKRREEMKFAYGSGLVDRGNEFARTGLLERAKQRYEEAFQADPTDHAAAYNLGLLALCAGDYATARDYFDKAVTLKELPLYMEGLKRAEDAAGTAPAQPSAATDAGVGHPAT